MNLVTSKAATKLELLFNKLASALQGRISLVAKTLEIYRE
jgi:hypothetical protein